MSRSRVRTPDPSVLDALAALLADPSRRVAALVAVAYATGVGGLVLSLASDPADPGAVFGVAGVALMGCSFVCLFVASLALLELADGDGRTRP